MFSQPPRTPAARSSTRILFFSISTLPPHCLSRRRLNTVSRQPVDFYRILMALDLTDHWLRQFDAQRLAVADGGDGCIAHQHHDVLARGHEFLAELLEALGDVDGVADHREVD